MSKALVRKLVDGAWRWVQEEDPGTRTFAGIYGDGSDGDITLAATTETIWKASTVYAEGDVIAPNPANGHRYVCTGAGTSDSGQPSFPVGASDTVTDGTVEWTEDGRHAIVANRLQRDLFANDLTIPDGLDLETGHFRVFVAGTCTLAGEDSDLCNDGATATWAAPLRGTIGQGVHGHDAGRTDVGDGGSGDGGASGWFPFDERSGNGGDAGEYSGGLGADNQGNPQVLTLPKTLPYELLTTTQHISNPEPGEGGGAQQGIAVFDNYNGGVIYDWGLGPGGGGDGANASGAGTVAGGGGGPAGVVLLAARAVVNNGVIRAKGGDGTDATGAGDAGGGGGGHGGVVIVVCDTYAGNQPEASGGLGGQGVGAGEPGENGPDGLVKVLSAS